MDHTNHLIHYGKAIKAILMATVQDPSKQSGIRGTPASKSLWTAAFQHQLLDSSCIEPSSEKAMAKELQWQGAFQHHTNGQLLCQPFQSKLRPPREGFQLRRQSPLQSHKGADGRTSAERMRGGGRERGKKRGRDEETEKMKERKNSGQ